MRILVTGGTGFVGRRLVAALLSRGHAVRVLARTPAALVGSGADAAPGDLRDAAAVAAACAGVAAVCHVGALSAPWGRSADFHAVNVGGTENVLAGCRAHGVRRLVHVSSPSVTFDGRDQVNVPEDRPYPRRFLSVYSLTKKIAEDRVRAAAAGGLHTVTLRPKAIFGEGDTTLLPRLVEAARRGRLPQIGDGTNRVDLTHVDNVVEAIRLALDTPVSGGCYTITNGESPELWPLIRTLLRRLGLSDRLRPVPYRAVYAMAALMEARAWLFGGEPTLTRYTTAILARTQTYDITAARRDLGYAPVVSLHEGVERTLEALQGAAAR